MIGSIFFRNHKVYTGAILMCPVNQHSSAMFACTFHQYKFTIWASSLTSLVRIHQRFVFSGMDIGVIENVITEAAEVAEVFTFEWHEPSILQFAFTYTALRHTCTTIDMGQFWNRKQDQQNDTDTQEKPPLFYFHAKEK